MFGLTTNRRLRAEVAAAKAETNRLRDERDAAVEEASAYQASAETAARQFVEVDEKYTDTCIVNELLTADLAKAKGKLAEYEGRRTVGEVLEEHDVHRKALAEALHAGLHLNWAQLIVLARGTYDGGADFKADYEAEKQRADRAEASLSEASSADIEAWDSRVKVRNAWTRPRDLEKRPIEGGSGRPTHPATELRQALERCRALQARLDAYGKQAAS